MIWKQIPGFARYEMTDDCRFRVRVNHNIIHVLNENFVWLADDAGARRRMNATALRDLCWYGKPMPPRIEPPSRGPSVAELRRLNQEAAEFGRKLGGYVPRVSPC